MTLSKTAVYLVAPVYKASHYLALPPPCDTRNVPYPLPRRSQGPERPPPPSPDPLSSPHKERKPNEAPPLKTQQLRPPMPLNAQGTRQNTSGAPVTPSRTTLANQWTCCITRSRVERTRKSSLPSLRSCLSTSWYKAANPFPLQLPIYVSAGGLSGRL